MRSLQIRGSETEAETQGKTRVIRTTTPGFMVGPDIGVHVFQDPVPHADLEAIHVQQAAVFEMSHLAAHGEVSIDVMLRAMPRR